MATFTQHFRAKACALGPPLARQGPGAHENVACVWPPRSTHVATSCNNAARCCFEMLRAFGQALMRVKYEKL